MAVVGLAAPGATGVAPPCVAVSVPREGNTKQLESRGH